jgi:hypothetical protein
MLLGFRLCRLELVEHCLWGDVQRDLLQVGSASVFTPIRSAIPDTSVTSLGDLVLRKQADLQIQVGSLVRGRGHAVLAGQHEGREEDGFHRGDHRQDYERGIPGGDAGDPAEVGAQKPNKATCR